MLAAFQQALEREYGIKMTGAQIVGAMKLYTG
jgi:hypothetical protein